MNANGVILFDYAHTTPVYTTTLMAGAFNDVQSSKQQVVAQNQKKKKFFHKNKKENQNQEKS
jgi:hypothetical protein